MRNFNYTLFPRVIPEELQSLIEDPMTDEDNNKFFELLNNYPDVDFGPDNNIARFYFNNYHHPVGYAEYLAELKWSVEEELKSVLLSNKSKAQKIFILIELKHKFIERDSYFEIIKDKDDQDIYIRNDMKDSFDYLSSTSFKKDEHLQATSFIKYQKKTIDDSLFLINELIEYVKENDLGIPESYLESHTHIKWNTSDTDLLELIVALQESNSIVLENQKTNRKELIRNFEKIFNIQIKDPESKLTRATERKKDTSPFLTNLKQSFEDYCLRKEERLDELGK